MGKPRPSPKPQKPPRWIGWGMPLRLVRFDQIAWVELRETEGTLYLIGGAAVEIDNESLLDVSDQLRRAGITELEGGTRWRQDPAEEDDEGDPPAAPRM